MGGGDSRGEVSGWAVVSDVSDQGAAFHGCVCGFRCQEPGLLKCRSAPTELFRNRESLF